MRMCRSLLAIAFLGVLTSQLSAEPPADRSRLSNNAALQYWQAFGQMPKLDKEQEEILANWDTTPLDDAAKKIVDQSRLSLMYFYRGAKMSQCDWGLDYNDGMNMLLPHLAKARDLARLAALHARYESSQGNLAAMRDDAHGIIAMARHVGNEPILICILVRIAIEKVVVRLVAPQIPQIKASYADAVAQFESLPRGATIAESLASERKYMAEWVVKALREADKKERGSWRRMWKEIMSYPEGAPAGLADIEDLDKVVKLVEASYPIYAELNEMIALPRSEFLAKYAPFMEKSRADNPLAQVLLPAIGKVIDKSDENKAEMAMLLAGVAVVEKGPDALKEIKDPFGDGPFEYRKLDKGFELTSKLRIDDKPVTVKFGP